MKQPGMKQLLSPSQGVSLTHLREKQLVAACSPVWLFNLGLHSASVLRSVVTLALGGHSLPHTVLEVINTCTHFAGHSLPTAAARLHRPGVMQAACITAHAMNSMLLWLIALGVILFPTATRGFLELHALGLFAEMLIESVLTYQYQLSLPIMALLHAFRQSGWMSVILWRMEGDLHRLLVRGTINWALLMLLSSFLEMRLRAAHRRACGVMGQQQEQRMQLEQQAGMSWAHPQLLDSIDDSANEAFNFAKPQPQVCIDAASKPGAACRRSGPIKLKGTMKAQATVGGPVAAFPGEAGAQLPVSPAPAAARVAQGVSVLPRVQQTQLAPQQQQAAQATLKAIKSKFAASYKRGRHGQSNTVHVKVEGIELEHLPPDLPELLQKQLSYCMPGVTMTGLALRRGCVMMTLDLMRYAEEGMVALSADSMQDLLTRLVQSQTMGQVLEDGAPMCIQMPDELALCRWDSTSGSYTSEGTPALAMADWYSCRMVSAGPAVHCLSDNATHTAQRAGRSPGTSASQLTLTVVLELPSHCRLHSWQQAGGLEPSGSSSPTNGAVVDAMLLARRLDGGYLPVVVQQVPCADKSSSDSAAHQITVQVVVSVAGEGSAALHLELWCKQSDAAGRAVGGTDSQLSWVPRHMPGLELLMAHMPLLVLPGSWKEAAAELQQHIDDIGGVQPEQASGHMAGTAANSRFSMKQQSYQDLSPDTGTLHGMPLAARPVVNTDQTGSGQPMQHNRSPKGSDSASSHTPDRSHPPANDSDSDPACCLLEDLGMLLTHQPLAGTTLAAAVPDGVMSQLGDDLLVYAVQHGLASVASVIVDTMQRIVQHSAASTAARPAIVSPSAWLLRVAGCASNSDSDGLSGGAGGLLHAAMASGSSEVLGHVFRWGTLYGGPDWAWPWELEDATGCTALHLAAAQPAAGACAALLKTITCMLPAAQVQAARNAWLHCQGGLGATPAQLFALASNDGYVGEMWRDVAPVHPNHTATNTRPGSATESTGAASSRASSSDSPQATVALTVQPSSTHAQSWLGSMVEVWTSREPEEYHTWAKCQDSLSVWYWAAALFAMSAACMHRSAVAGCWQYEWLHLAFYTWFMIPAVVATAGNNEWLGSKKVWTVLAKVMPVCSWLAKARVPNHQAATWISAGTTGADMIYVLMIGVAIDKIPMPQLVLARAMEALAHAHAYRTAGFPYPLSRALAVHSISLMLSVAIRTRKLMAFYRWQAMQQDLRQRGLCLPCAAKEPQGRKQS